MRYSFKAYAVRRADADFEGIRKTNALDLLLGGAE